MKKLHYFFYIFSFFASICCADELTYLGIIGPGTGNSIAGHALVIMAKAPGLVEISDTYQFNIEEQTGKDNGILEFLGAGKRFTVDKYPAAFYFTRERKQGHPVALYELNLTNEERKKFYEELEKQYQKRKSEVIKDYNIINSNCLTEIFKILNEIVPPEKQLKTVWTEGLRAFPDTLNPLVFFSNIPLMIVAELNSHPLVKGPAKFLPPFSLDLIRSNLLMAITIESLAETCHWNSSKKDIFKRLSFKTNIRNRKSYLDYLKSESIKCGKEQTAAPYNTILSIIEYTTDEELNEGKQKKLVQSYFWDEYL